MFGGDIINTTITGNSSDGWGGGIYSDLYITLVNSTITLNVCDADNDGQGIGGGIYVGTFHFGHQGDVELHNTIVAGNGRVTTSAPNDIAGRNVIATSSFNLIGSPFNSGGLVHGQIGNILGDQGTKTLPISQILNTTLADNGGPTPTHALKADSVAINAGSNAFALDDHNQPLSFDQRGTGFGRIVNGRVDIGAFEVQAVQNFVVDTLVDENDGNYAAVDLSLREAITLANQTSLADTISFSSKLTGGIIRLTLGELDVTEDLTIRGLGADKLTINGNFSTRLFDISNPDKLIDVEIRDLQLYAGGNKSMPMAERSTTRRTFGYKPFTSIRMSQRLAGRRLTITMPNSSSAIRPFIKAILTMACWAVELSRMTRALHMSLTRPLSITVANEVPVFTTGVS